MKKRWLVIIAILLPVVSTAPWWLGGQDIGTTTTQHPTPIPVVETILAPVEPTPEKMESGSEAVNMTTANVARRLVHVPDTRPPRDAGPATDLRDATAGNIEHLLQANLEGALDGEMASAYFVTRSRIACERFASTPEDLEKRIQRTNKKAEKDLKRGRDLSRSKDNALPWSITPDTKDNRAQLEHWYEACLRVQSMFTPDLRRQLELLAMKGDAMAGYLYATWPLEQLNVGDAFEQQYRWEGLARDFSQANLDRGEVAGLMAFAQTYMNGWFTERNGDLALAFAIAAVNCSFEAYSLSNFLANRIENLTNSDDPADLQRLEFALAEADRLGSHCVP